MQPSPNGSNRPLETSNNISHLDYSGNFNHLATEHERSAKQPTQISIERSSSEHNLTIAHLEQERLALERRAQELDAEREKRAKKIMQFAKEIESLDLQETERLLQRKTKSQLSIAEPSYPALLQENKLADLSPQPGVIPDATNQHKSTQTQSAQEDAARELVHFRAENTKLKLMNEEMKRSLLVVEKQLQISTDEKMNLIRSHEEVWKLAKNLQSQIKLTQEENERLKKRLAEQSAPPKYGSSADKYKGNQERGWGNESGLHGTTIHSREEGPEEGSQGRRNASGWRFEQSLGADFLYLPALKKNSKPQKDSGLSGLNGSPAKASSAVQLSPMRVTVRSSGGATHSTQKLSKDKAAQEAAYKANLAKVQSPPGLEGYKLWLLNTREMDFLKDPKAQKQKKPRIN